MTNGQLLIPAMQAARSLGITRRTLRNHIEAGLVRSVKMFSRTYVPQAEIDRIVNGEPSQESAPKSQGRNDISASGNNMENASIDERYEALRNSGASPSEFIAAISHAYGEWLGVLQTASQPREPAP